MADQVTRYFALSHPTMAATEMVAALLDAPLSPAMGAIRKLAAGNGEFRPFTRRYQGRDCVVLRVPVGADLHGTPEMMALLERFDAEVVGGPWTEYEASEALAKGGA